MAPRPGGSVQGGPSPSGDRQPGTLHEKRLLPYGEGRKPSWDTAKGAGPGRSADQGSFRNGF